MLFRSMGGQGHQASLLQTTRPGSSILCRYLLAKNQTRLFSVRPTTFGHFLAVKYPQSYLRFASSVHPGRENYCPVRFGSESSSCFEHNPYPEELPTQPTTQDPGQSATVDDGLPELYAPAAAVLGLWPCNTVGRTARYEAPRHLARKVLYSACPPNAEK